MIFMRTRHLNSFLFWIVLSKLFVLACISSIDNGCLIRQKLLYCSVVIVNARLTHVIYIIAGHATPVLFPYRVWRLSRPEVGVPTPPSNE